MYLKPQQYYIDLYDRETVELCREKECYHRKVLNDALVTAVGDERHWRNLFYKLSIFFDVEMFEGERWEPKEKTIAAWMNRNRVRDSLLATAEAPEHVTCLTCKAKMVLVGKELADEDAHGEERILFLFECPKKCRPQRAFFNDGTEMRPKSKSCLVCRGEMTTKTSHENEVFVLSDTCVRCGHTDTLRFDPPQPAAPDPEFAKDRDRYCYTDERAQEYLKDKANVEATNRWSEVNKSNEGQKKLKERISQIKMLTITDLEKLIAAKLENSQFGRVNFGNPETGRFFIVQFNARDLKEGREERQAIKELQKINTNHAGSH